MRNLAILGSTGSIGRQALDVAARHPELFRISVLAAHSSGDLLKEQIEKFHPDLAVLVDEEAAHSLRARCGSRTEVLGGEDALEQAARFPAVDTVLTSMVGFAGLKPTIAAITAGKTIALANKETLVGAGKLVTGLAQRHNVPILPVDSEHCAILQSLRGDSPRSIHKIWLTASGGPFRGWNASQMEAVEVSQVLKHPNWAMGAKITVDSATLVNKALEVIEAKWLFDVSYDQIQVVVHPQSIVHSMVEYADGSVLAQLGCPDMRLPIQYALTYPERVDSEFPRLDFWKMGALSFAPPDTENFPGLMLGIEAGRKVGTLPCVFSAANEVAVHAFLEKKIKFTTIVEVIQAALAKHDWVAEPDLDQITAADAWARRFAAEAVKELAQPVL